MAKPPPHPALYTATLPRTSPPEWEQPAAGAPPRKFKTGAKPTPADRLKTAKRATFAGAPPDNFAVVPGKLSMWGNADFGICVTSEEAFAKACYRPEIFLSEKLIIDWATPRGFRDGAMLDEVLDAMLHDGFKDGAQQYNDGAKSTVDFTSEAQLKLAISKGPVKIGIDSSALPSGAGNQQGWYATGGKPNQFRNTDHCVSLSSYGTADYLFKALGVPLPSGLKPDAQGYLLFTWSTLGFVDLPWLLSTCTEAWSRTPTTVGVPPLAPEPPDPGPTPTPAPSWWQLVWAVIVWLWNLLNGNPADQFEAWASASALPAWLLTLLQLLLQLLINAGHDSLRSHPFMRRRAGGAEPARPTRESDAQAEGSSGSSAPGPDGSAPPPAGK